MKGTTMLKNIISSAKKADPGITASELKLAIQKARTSIVEKFSDVTEHEYARRIERNNAQIELLHMENDLLRITGQLYRELDLQKKREELLTELNSTFTNN